LGNWLPEKPANNLTLQIVPNCNKILASATIYTLPHLQILSVVVSQHAQQGHDQLQPSVMGPTKWIYEQYNVTQGLN
jgi:hypothetical protein